MKQKKLYQQQKRTTKENNINKTIKTSNKIKIRAEKTESSNEKESLNLNVLD